MCADITKCTNTECPLADKCFRIKAEDNLRQSYATFEPVQVEAEAWECDYFMTIWNEET